MKFLIEFAKFRDIVKNINNDDHISELINKKFEDDVPLLTSVTNNRYDKTIKLNWYDTKKHSIVDKIRDRTPINSVSEFNDVIRYGLNEVFPSEIGGSIREGGRYILHFNENRFYLIISVNYNNLFDDDSEIFIVTVSQNTEDGDIIEIYDD